MKTNNKRNKMVAILLLGAFLAIGTLVFFPEEADARAVLRTQMGQRDRDFFPMFPGRPDPGRMLPMLDLTAEQMERLRAVHDEYRDEMKAARESAFEARRDLMQAARDGADEPTIRELANALAEAETDLALVQSRLHAQIKESGILTPEQWERMEELRARAEKRIERFRERRDQRLQQRPQ